MQLRPVRIDEESCSLPPWLQPHRQQPRTPNRPLDDTRPLDLPIQLIDVIDADAAHEGALFGHEIGNQEELQLKLPAAENQPAIIAIRQLESDPP